MGLYIAVDTEVPIFAVMAYTYHQMECIRYNIVDKSLIDFTFPLFD